MAYVKYEDRLHIDDEPLAFLRHHSPTWYDANMATKKWPKIFDTPNYFQGDDTYARSNRRVWAAAYDDLEGKNWWDIGGDGILVRLNLLTTDQQEALDNLDGYPVLDDSDHSELEHELETENWNDYGRRDFIKALLKGLEEGIEQDTAEKILDALPEEAIDHAYYEMARRQEAWPEHESDGGTNFPDPEEMLEHDEAFPTWDVPGLLKWLGKSAQLHVRLSPKAFCRLKPQDKDKDYEGAVYMRYGEPWILDIGRAALPSKPGMAQLFAMHSDDSAKYIGLENAPTVTVDFYLELMENPYLLTEYDYVDEIKRRKLLGWEQPEDHEYTDEEIEADRARERLHARAREIALDALLRCGQDEPADDLINEVSELMLLDENSATALLGVEDAAGNINVPARLSEFACARAKDILAGLPPYCDFTQLRLPGVREAREKKARRA